MTGVYSQLDGLGASPTPDTFVAVPLVGFDHHRIAKDHLGRASILVRMSVAAEQLPLDVRLENFEVRYCVACEVVSEGSVSERGIFTTIRCLSEDPRLTRYFLDVVLAVLPSIGQLPTAARTATLISELVRLFRALGRPPMKSVQGLWAELLMIAEAVDGGVLGGAWRQADQEQYDFSSGPDRLEVKSSSSARSHYFSLSQLTPPPATRVVIASVEVHAARGGTSLGELLEEAASAAGPNHAGRIRAVAAETLGNVLLTALDAAYDRQAALASLLFFDAGAVPRVATPVPVEVTDVRFRVDMSAVPALATPIIDSGNGFFSALPTLSAPS